jgi:hypothetical protein
MESHEDPKIKAAIRLPPILIFADPSHFFLPGLKNEFVSWDDDTNLLENPSYGSLG